MSRTSSTNEERMYVTSGKAGRKATTRKTKT
jgi:hypothetical protein